MATYKVIQDIEAEDKLVWKLSLWQFIYAGICAFCLYICFIAVAKHIWFMLAIFLPPALFAAFFAWPWGRDQPTDVWALAKIRFMLKPRKRIWNQSGVKELVTITAPKKVEKIYTNGLSEGEVHSRLNALAATIDSRGWAIKNVNVNLYNQRSLQMPNSNESDRLIDVSTLPQEVANIDVTASDDILDEQNNPIAQQFDHMLDASTQTRRQHLMDEMRSPAPAPQPTPTPAAQAQQPPADYWFLHEPVNAPKPSNDNVVFANPQLVQPGADSANAGLPTPTGGVPVAAEPTADEQAFAEHLKEQHYLPKATYSHLKTIQPLGTPQAQAQQAAQQQAVLPEPQPEPPVTEQPDPAKMDLARNNDLSVATIARLANHKDESDDNEVVISLH